MNDLVDLLKKNRTAAIWIAASIGVLLLASALAACQVDDWVKVDVPDPIAEAIEVESTITVAESGAAWDEWIAYVERNSNRFAGEIDRGRETVGIITSLTETGITFGTQAASTLPGGAILSSGLALLGGLFLKRPGDAKKEQKEKEDSYNAGLAKGKVLAEDAMEAIYALRNTQTDA